MRAGVHSLGRAVDLLFAGRKPLAVARPPGQLRPRGPGRRACEPISQAGQALPVVHPDDPLDKCSIGSADAPYSILPVVDADNRLLGIVNLEEIHVGLAGVPHAAI